MTSSHDDDRAPSSRRSSGEPARDPALRAMLEQLHADAPPPNPALLARLRTAAAPELAARAAGARPARVSRREVAQNTFRVGFAAAMAAMIFALLRPVPGAPSQEELLLSAAIGAVSADTQRLWQTERPLGLPMLRPTLDRAQ